MLLLLSLIGYTLTKTFFTFPSKFVYRQKTILMRASSTYLSSSTSKPHLFFLSLSCKTLICLLMSFVFICSISQSNWSSWTNKSISPNINKREIHSPIYTSLSYAFLKKLMESYASLHCYINIWIELYRYIHGEMSAM